MAITKIQSESLNLADDYTFTGDIVGAGGNNKPMVLARCNSGTSCSDGAATKITLDNELIDTDNLFASSRFTVTSGYEGKYLVHWRLSFNHTANEKYALSLIYKNGSNLVYGQHWSGRGSNHTMMTEASYIVDMTTNDYLEFYGQQNSGTRSNNGGDLTHVYITKLIT